MNIRLFENRDYEEVSSWWEKQNWPVIPKEMLSNVGFIAEEDKLIAATWVFSTNCPIYIMEWTVGNPEVNWKKRQEGLNKVTLAACQWAKDNGAKQLFTMTKSERFIEKLEDCGFQKTDVEMTHLIRSL